MWRQFSLLHACAAISLLTYDAPGQGPMSWLEAAKLTASDAADNDSFGFSLSMDGETLVIGTSTIPGPNPGKVLVFEKPTTGWRSATETAVLTASNGAPFDGFGFSVSISGDTIVVGSWLADIEGNRFQGAAYVFEKPAGGWTTMTETAVLTASDGGARHNFGSAVTLSGDVLVVTAPGATGPVPVAGAAYVFERPATGWESTTETAVLTASDGRNGDLFGFSASMANDTVVVGAPSAAGIAGTGSPGAVYLFEKPASGWENATETAKLNASPTSQADALGDSVSISADTVVAGAPTEDAPLFNEGAAYVFEKPTTGWQNATEIARLVASDGRWNDHFGTAVSIHGGAIVAGAQNARGSGSASQGAAYVFERPATGWENATETRVLIASDGAAGDNFGSAVLIHGGTVVGGAPYAEVDGAVAGAAYVFDAPVVAPGSGCGLNAVETAGSRRLGGELDMSMPLCAPASAYAFALGTALAAPVALPPPLPCSGLSSCLLSCAAAFSIPGPQARITIPPDPTLIGLTFCLQGICAETATPCLRLTDMVTIAVSS